MEINLQYNDSFCLLELKKRKCLGFSIKKRDIKFINNLAAKEYLDSFWIKGYREFI